MGRQLNSSAVYVVGVHSNPVKIGIADNLAARLSGLQVGCPDELILHHHIQVPWAIARDIERAAHAALKDRHRRGEWFDVDKTEAIALLERIRVDALAGLRSQVRETGGDLLDRLNATYVMRAAAREAWLYYREQQSRPDGGFVPHANGYVLKECGMAAYAAFSLVIAQSKALEALKGEELTRAEGALAKAINALADFYEDYSEARRRRAIGLPHRRSKAA